MADRAESATDDTLTANEVAATAVGHGFDPDAVRELTGLFEAVRYGDEPVTETAGSVPGVSARIDRRTGGSGRGRT